jgi:hypothetical protein
MKSLHGTHFDILLSNKNTLTSDAQTYIYTHLLRWRCCMMNVEVWCWMFNRTISKIWRSHRWTDLLLIFLWYRCLRGDTPYKFQYIYIKISVSIRLHHVITSCVLRYWRVDKSLCIDIYMRFIPGKSKVGSSCENVFGAVSCFFTLRSSIPCSIIIYLYKYSYRKRNIDEYWEHQHSTSFHVFGFPSGAACPDVSIYIYIY